MTHGTAAKRSPRWLVLNGRRVPHDPRMKAIVEALEAREKTYKQIAKDYGITKMRVAQIRKFAGLPPRRGEGGK